VKPAPVASVLLPVRDEARHLPRALAHVLAQRVDGGLEVLAIDGGSTDGSRAVLEQAAASDPRVRVLDNPARRTPEALNLGLREARGTYVARMDAHTWYPPDYLQQGIERLARGGAEHVSGPQLAEGDGRWSHRIALALRSPMGVGGARFRRAAGAEVELDSGFTGVWRRETLVAHGGWDAGWPVNQDAELAARIRAAGGRVIGVPEMAARYVPRDSLRALARQYWRYGQYRVKTSVRHPDSMRRSHWLPPAFMVSAVGAVARGPQRAIARTALAAWAAGAALTAAQAARDGAAPADAAAVPLVLATMHLAWGAGFVAGCVRFGFPLAALAATPTRPAARAGGGPCATAATTAR
jgi:succinoglycan biosynthesis protein ExoA